MDKVSAGICARAPCVCVSQLFGHRTGQCKESLVRLAWWLKISADSKTENLFVKVA